MKLTLWVLLIVTAAVLGFWYYWWNIAQPTTPRSEEGFTTLTQRSPIDASSFTREDTISALETIKSQSSISSKFTNLATTSLKEIEPTQLPEDIAEFVVPGPGEQVTVSKSDGVVEYYYIHYFSEIALPESSPRFSRLAHPKEYRVIYGFRNFLAGILDLESKKHIIRVSQLSVSENRTEIIIYAITK